MTLILAVLALFWISPLALLVITAVRPLADFIGNGPLSWPDHLTWSNFKDAWDIGNFANPKYYFRWDSPEFQKVFTESQVTVDDKKRRELYVKMQQMLADEAPAVWLYMHPRLVAAKKGLTGIWKDLPLLVFDLSEVAWQK